MNQFDQIRCYADNEIPEILQQLCNEKQFINVVSTAYPLLPKEVIKQRLCSYKDVYTFQKEFIYPFLHNLEATKSNGILLKGIDKLDRNNSYIFLSNHRDIVLDAAFLCIKFIEIGFDTVEVAIGDNLLVYPWIEHFARVNKSFIVKRGLSLKQIFESSKLLSEYIKHVISDKKQSLWIAQREGRAKNSDDRTQESIIKMLNMSGKSNNIADNLLSLNICPLTISYEYDPCDYLKAKEFQQKRDNPDFKKETNDDLLNMQIGILGYKGRIEYCFAGSINDYLPELWSQSADKNQFFSLVAAHIDRKIHSNYQIYNINKIAYDKLNNTQRFAADYSIIEKLDFEKYLTKQIDKIDLPDKDHDFLMRKLLEMYANPLVNYLVASGK
ncbi:MAG: acyltransferase [Paludibacter sp.]|jgi:hypothetical protein|nr:acyltransferase [Paludibacter sp.]